MHGARSNRLDTLSLSSVKSDNGLEADVLDAAWKGKGDQTRTGGDWLSATPGANHETAPVSWSKNRKRITLSVRKSFTRRNQTITWDDDLR
jgi:hypothetical protein